MVGKRSGKGLYHLNVIVKTDDPLAVAAAARTKISLSTLHQRLAHLNCRDILRLIKMKTVEEMDSPQWLQSWKNASLSFS